MYHHPTTRTSIIVHPRTASRAIAHAAIVAGFNRVAGHHEVCTDTLRQSTRVYVSVRNHFDALASWYTADPATALEHGSLGAWFRHWYTRDVLGGRTDAMGVYVRPGELFPWTRRATGQRPCHLIRYESLEQDIDAALGGVANIPHTTDPASTRGRTHYAAYYDTETAALVAATFGDEITRLGYAFEMGI